MVVFDTYSYETEIYDNFKACFNMTICGSTWNFSQIKCKLRHTNQILHGGEG